MGRPTSEYLVDPFSGAWSHQLLTFWCQVGVGSHMYPRGAPPLLPFFLSLYVQEGSCAAVQSGTPSLTWAKGREWTAAFLPATAQWMDVSVGPQSFCPDLVILYGRWLELLWRSSRNEHLNDSGADVAPGTSLKLYFSVGSVMLKPSGTGMVSSLLIMGSIQQVA